MTTILDAPGSNASDPFSTLIQALLTSNNFASTPAPTTELSVTVVDLITKVNTSRDPAHALWELWDAFFKAVVNLASSHAPYLALLDALRAQPPTQPSNVRAGSDAERQLRSYSQADGKLHWSALPRFGAQWRDVHDILEAWRDWDGVRASSVRNNSSASTLSSSGDVYYIRFCEFSAALLKATKGEDVVHPIWVFYACRNVLERGGPQSRQPKPHRLSAEQTWVLDVRVAAVWMRDGGRTLWEIDYEELRRHWATALDEKTELWPREDGLTKERWRLWEKRLLALSTKEGHLAEDTRLVVTDAANVVGAILEESST